MWLLQVTLMVTILLWSSGTSQSKNNNYITYYPGTLPVIIGSPHGGSLKPRGVHDRDAGCWDGSKCIWAHGCGRKDTGKCGARTISDRYTKELAQLLRSELYNIFGKYPHLIVCELHRSKMDANRQLDEATFGVPSMMQAWTQFHTYINQSKVVAQPQPSLYIDIHGHAHRSQRAELGYLLSGSRLDSNRLSASYSSVRRLAGSVNVTFNELLRGRLSFGGILESEGYAAVPSFRNPGPNGNPYYSGGTNTKMHGSRDGGNTDAIQIESPTSFRSAARRSGYARALAKTMQRYMARYYNFNG